jgi:hypothetical protein
MSAPQPTVSPRCPTLRSPAGERDGYRLNPFLSRDGDVNRGTTWQI